MPTLPTAQTPAISVVSPVTIYTATLCPYCRRAKDLLRSKGATFEEIDVTEQPLQRTVMAARASGRATVPQIFIGETHVGGCDDLHALERAGRLDALLAAGTARLTAAIDQE